MGLRKRLNTAQDRAHPPAHKPAVRRLAICIVVAVLATLVVAPASAHAISMTKAEKKVLALVNHARATHGLHKLKMVRSLERASRAHSREMASSNYFSHNSYDGESFAARLIRFGYTPSGCTSWTVGEDIAFGYDSGGTPKAIFEAWMHSARTPRRDLQQALPQRRRRQSQGHVPGHLRHGLLHARLRSAQPLEAGDGSLK